jgi:membrane protease YdiL (CAAX protease family)
LRFLRGLGSFAAWLACSIGLAVAGQRAGVASHPAFELLNAAGLLAAYVVCVRVIERRRAAELSARGAAGEYLAGFAIGLGIFAVSIGSFALFGWYRIAGGTWSPSVLASGLAFCVLVAVTEEILLRGYACRFLQSSGGTWAAIGLSAALFGSLHFFNPHASAWSAAAIGIEAGVLLAAAFLLTGRLWIALGIHTSWNFAEGPLFGTPVSGLDLQSVTQATIAGPAWLTGGSFGPEASPITVAVCAALSAIFIVKLVRENRIVPPPRWRARAAQKASA